MKIGRAGAPVVTIALLCAIHIQAAGAHEAHTGTVVPGRRGQQALARVAALSPAIIGADGPDLTQVEAAQQQLGLSGKGTTICVIDTGVDTRNPTFGAGCPHGAQCRIAWGYDVESGRDDPTPTDLANAGGHGTHVSSIALGSFLHKLLDAQGQPLPYQQGVAAGAKLGAVRACTRTSEFPANYTQHALSKAVQRRCDVVNLSLGGFYVTPSPLLASAVAAATNADIIMTAAQGNDDSATQDGARLFNTASPGATKRVLSVGHVNNTATLGAVLQLDRAIDTPSGKRSTLYANQRADTPRSMCAGECAAAALKLPQEVVLIRMDVRPGTEGSAATVACDMQAVPDNKLARTQPGAVVLLQVAAACKQFQNSPEHWELLQGLEPALVLISLPNEADSATGPMFNRNAQTPVMWLRPQDGSALAAALARDPPTPIRLAGVPGAVLVPVPAGFAGQPAPTSALGPAYDLDMKPDVSAPGALYSSLPGGAAQTWSGTSMAAPYVAGVAALWKEAVMRRQGHLRPPLGGWVDAAAAALKNTARPLPYRGSPQLMWPPVKVGAGVVQALHAAVTRVTVTPTELLARTDVSSQRLRLTLRNSGVTDVTYALAHRPGVSVSLATAWYGRALDATLPTASVVVAPRVVTVAAGATASVQVHLAIPASLQRIDAIFGGYVTLTPVARGTKDVQQPVPLSVPYQGASRDYSSFADSNSLALFVPVLPHVDATAARELASLPHLFLCDAPGGSDECARSATGALEASPRAGRGLRVVGALARPVADVRFHVWAANGTQHLGTSPSQGPGAAAPPLRRTYLTATGWDGSYHAVADSAGANGTLTPALAYVQPGRTYRLKVELWPVLAAGDRLAGRRPAREPLVVELDTLLRVVEGKRPS